MSRPGRLLLVRAIDDNVALLQYGVCGAGHYGGVSCQRSDVCNLMRRYRASRLLLYMVVCFEKINCFCAALVAGTL